MELVDALALPRQGAISLVGGGGKSTLLTRLSAQLAATGQRVVTLTTTRITLAQGQGTGFLLCTDDPAALAAALALHPVVCAATPYRDGKLGPPPPALLQAAIQLADWVLAEADGAKCLPIKAPANHEPVLLPQGLTVAVAGLCALGLPLGQVCFRPQLAAALLGVGTQAPLTPALLARLLTSAQGQYKGVQQPSLFRVVLNQADLAPQGAAEETASEICRHLPGCRVVATALGQTDCVKGVFFDDNNH